MIHRKLENICIGQYPPCDHPTLNYYEVEIKSATCIYYENKYIPPYPGEDAMWLLRAKSCGAGKCVSTYRVCLDYQFSPPKISTELISRTIENAYCPPNGRPNLPPEGKS
ncbi:MAG: hypothetical protein N2319_07315 [Candidatus Kapabacteria bacterium]|nr:hypothetical protein [Candidatus Kapabacteria bacterium]